MRLTIGRKLGFGFAAAGLLMLGCVAIGRIAQVRASKVTTAIEQTYAMVNDLEYLTSYARAVTVAQRAYLISGDEAAAAGIPALRADADLVIARVSEETHSDPDLAAQFADWRSAVMERRAYVNKLNQARKQDGFDAAKALFDTGQDDRLLARMIGDTQTMKAQALARVEALKADDATLQKNILLAEALSIAVALLLLTAVAWALSRSVQRNVNISVALVEAMAQKDLSVADGNPASADELSTAIHSINAMKHAMADALRDVAASSAQVASAGVQIEANAHQISATTHEEQRNVSQFASALAEMNATVQEVAQHAERASHDADTAVKSAETGQKVVEQAHHAMSRIRDTVMSSSQAITTLGKETESIGEVVRIIEDIAGQTNLLALNASIEAARAGVHGKGFAVVAQEVRALAERTARFTKEIDGKITVVQQGADRAVQAMHQGETVVNEGVARFSEVSGALDQMLQRIGAAQLGIQMIATATTQQSAATGGLTENMHAISSEVDLTTEQVDQTAAACAELALLASGLQRVVDAFRLPDQRNTLRPSH